MREYVIELSRYLIAVLMAAHVLGSFLALFGRMAGGKPGRAERGGAIHTVQGGLLFLMQLLMFADLALVTGETRYVLFYVFVQAFLLVMAMITPIAYRKIDLLLLDNMCLLLGTGLCVLSRLSFQRAVKQYIIVLLSLVVSLFLPLILPRIRFLQKLAWVYAGVGLTLLCVVLALGEVTHGSRLSIAVGGAAFQPSEFVKILFVFFLAGALWEETSLARVALTAVLAGAHVAVLAASRDLGSALIFFVGYVFIVFTATRNPLCLLAGALGGSGAAWLAWRFFAHVRDRVAVWRDPWSCIDDEGYAVTQSLFAISGGDWFGSGLARGNPGAIPYVAADFTFSAICEELGVLFGICVILAVLACFLAMLSMAFQIKDRFYQLVVYGLGVLYLFQGFLTIGGGVNLIPLTGVTLPLISLGGSSAMATTFLFFLLQGIRIRQRQEEGGRGGTNTIPRKSILVTGLLGGAAFAVLAGYLGYFTATRKEEMFNNSYNSRQGLLAAENYRGAIYSRDGETLAQTVVDESRGEVRTYPFAGLFSHIVGYSTKGRMGVEALANYYLSRSSVSPGRRASNGAAGVKNQGDSVYTTLDVQMQETADAQLGSYRGAILVTEVSTGKILAMVSHPDFDPNQIPEIWDSLLGAQDSSVLLNRVTQGLYPPGSTFKIATALEYIRENPETYAQYSFQCPGSFSSGGSHISCYHGIAHGQVDFRQAFAKSCNSAFADIGVGLDREKFRETLEGLLFHQPLPLALPYAQGSVTVSGDSGLDEVIQTSFGQGKTQVAPAHLHMITSAIANGGLLMKPYVLDRVENDDGRVVKAFGAEPYGQLVTEGEAQILRSLMASVVEEGTGRKLSGLSYTAAGKTGSAEYSSAKEDSHAWFTGFAPAQDPEICVTVLVEGAGSAGDYAVPIAKRIFDTYFNEKK